jgi:SAM-dependent methyltransferase
MTHQNDILRGLQDYFTNRITTYGANFRGVDWNSAARQELCFRQLMRICEEPAQGIVAQDFSINDYGCGYGALVQYLVKHDYKFASYTGFEITQAMSDKAREMFGNLKNCRFTEDENTLSPAHYTIASGLLSLKLDNNNEQWEKYVLQLLDRLWTLSEKGFAFNSLTKYSDPDLLRPELYYADPCFLFDYCKTRFSRNVALLHDYGVYEFTILVRRD